MNSDSDLIRAKANRVALQFSELYPGDDEREEESDNESDFVAPDSESEDEDLHDLVTMIFDLKLLPIVHYTIQQ